jgi:hypothetical protein
MPQNLHQRAAELHATNAFRSSQEAHQKSEKANGKK